MSLTPNSGRSPFPVSRGHGDSRLHWNGSRFAMRWRDPRQLFDGESTSPMAPLVDRPPQRADRFLDYDPRLRDGCDHGRAGCEQVHLLNALRPLPAHAGRPSVQRDGGLCAVSDMNEWQKMGSR